jgi:hypothetical protein
LAPADKSAAQPRRAYRLRRTVRHALLAILALAALLLVGAAWTVADPQRARLAVEQTVGFLSGKPLTIDGRFDYAFGRLFTLRAGSIRWHDANPGASPLLEIEQGELVVDLWSLVRGPLRISDLRVQGAQARFDWSGEGFNWGAATRRGDASARRLPVIVEHASIADATLHFRHPRLTDDLTLEVVSLRHTPDAANHLRLTASLRLEDDDLTLSGRIGPLPELLAAGAVDLEGSLVGPLGALTFSGESAALRDLQDLVLLIELQAADVAALARRLRLPLHTTGGVELAATVDTRGPGVEIDGKGFFGAYRVEASGSALSLDSMRDIGLDMTVEGEDFGDIAAMAGWPATTAAMPFRLHTKIVGQGAGQDAQVDAQIKLGGMNGSLRGSLGQAEGLAGSRLRFALDAADASELAAWLDLPLPRRQALRLGGRIALETDQVRFDALDATLGQARFTGHLVLGGRDFSEASFDLRARADDASALIPEDAGYRPPALPLVLAARGRADATSLGLAQLQADLGKARLSLTGTLRHRPSWTADGLRLEAAGPRLSDLGSLGSYTPPARPFTLSASLTGDAQRQRIDQLRFRSGDNDLGGRIQWTPGERPDVQLDLASARFDIDDFTSTATSKAAVAPERRMFGDQPIALDWLGRFDASVRLRVDELLSAGRRWRNAVVVADIERGALQLHRAALDAARGKLTLSGTLEPSASGASLALAIEASDAMLVTESMTPGEIEQLPRHAINARLSATGRTPSELARSVDGYIWVIGGAGYARRTRLAPMFGDLVLEVLTAINPAGAQEPDVRIDCDGLYLEVEQGKITTAPAFVLKTDRLLVFARGAIDLHTEQLDILFDTTPLRGVGLSLGDVVNPLTKLSGRLSEPVIVLDPKGALVEGGAAVATSGLSILVKSVFKRWFLSPEVCQRVGRQALEIRRARDPVNLPDLASLVGVDTSDAAAEPSAAAQGDADNGGHRLFDMSD